MKNDKVLSLLGLARRAGKTDSGEFSVENAVKSGKAVLVITACDASENSKKKFRDMCAYYHVEYAEYGDKAALGNSMGQEMRAAASVRDEGLARAILERIRS